MIYQIIIFLQKRSEIANWSQFHEIFIDKVDKIKIFLGGMQVLSVQRFLWLK